MFKTIVDAFKVKEIRVKILITLLLLLIFRIGCWLPVPGISLEYYGKFAGADSGEGFLGLLSILSGGALSNAAVLALGVTPYINSSIIIQLLTFAIPSLKNLSEQGEDGRKKISLYTRIAALVLAIAQSIGIVVAFKDYIDPNFLGSAPMFIRSAFIVITMVAGAMFTVWLGERITEQGIGNGLSLLIFVGILSTAGQAIFSQIVAATTDVNKIWSLILFFVAVVIVFGLIVFVDGGERKVQVQYAKQVKGRKMYGGQNTYIPIRVNGSGVMPVIFASALISFPQMLISIFDSDASSGFAQWWNKWLGAGSWVYMVVTCLLILFFAYFYAQMTFNPDDIAKRIQQNGGFIPGYRPGKPTAEYLGKISRRITFFGAVYLAFLVLVPSIIFGLINQGLVNAFSATGLMIVVSVALEFDKQLNAQMLMRNYKGFLK